MSDGARTWIKGSVSPKGARTWVRGQVSPKPKKIRRKSMTKKKFVFVPGLAWLPERRAVKSEHEKEMLLKEGKRLAIEENEEAFGLLGVKDYRVYLRRRAEHIEHLRRLRGKEEYEQKFE